MDKSERANTILKGYSGTQDDKLGLQEQLDQVIFFSFFFFLKRPFSKFREAKVSISIIGNDLMT